MQAKKMTIIGHFQRPKSLGTVADGAWSRVSLGSLAAQAIAVSLKNLGLIGCCWCDLIGGCRRGCIAGGAWSRMCWAVSLQAHRWRVSITNCDYFNISSGNEERNPIHPPDWASPTCELQRFGSWNWPQPPCCGKCTAFCPGTEIIEHVAGTHLIAKRK